MKWSDSDIKEIIHHLEDGKNFKEISVVMNRSYTSLKTIARRKNIRYKSYKKIIINLCKVCNKPLKTGKIYCSISCTNKDKPKRKLSNYCKDCNKPIYSSRKYCDDCGRLNTEKIENLTLSEAIYHKHHRSSAFALVRTRARQKAKKLNLNKCLVCGYDKHVEICHKKPISKFSLDTKISVINHENNLLPFCRNHHWEYDHGLLDKGDWCNG